MRILFIGETSQHPTSRPRQRKSACEELGHEVISHSSVPEEMTYYDKGSLRRRILWKVGLVPDETKINKTILREIQKHHFDVLWIEKGNVIWPRTLRAVKKRSSKTQIVSYSGDDMFIPTHRSVFYTTGLKHYDVVFTYKSYNAEPNELPRLGAKRVVLVDNSYDMYLHRPIPVTPEDIEAFGADVGFIGSYERERANSMLHLAENGVPVRVWGLGGWHKLLGRYPNLIIENRPLYGDDYVKGLCATRVNLCFLRKLNRDRQTDRTFEIPACGAFMLAERTSDHLRLFEEGMEAAYFGSNRELLEKIYYYLNHPEEREAVASAGRKRCLNSGYSHHHRMQYMLSVAVGDK